MQLPHDLNAHDALNEVIIREIHNTLLSSIPSSKAVCQSSKLDTAGDVVIEGDLSIGAVSFCNWIHSLGTQPKSHGCQGLLQFLGIHCSTAIAVKTDEVLSPAIQDSPEFFKFIEAHCAWHISIQHWNHKPASLQVKRFVSSSDARLCQASLQFISIYLPILSSYSRKVTVQRILSLSGKRRPSGSSPILHLEVRSWRWYLVVILRRAGPRRVAKEKNPEVPTGTADSSLCPLGPWQSVTNCKQTQQCTQLPRRAPRGRVCDVRASLLAPPWPRAAVSHHSPAVGGALEQWPLSETAEDAQSCALLQQCVGVGQQEPIFRNVASLLISTVYIIN